MKISTRLTGIVTAVFMAFSISARAGTFTANSSGNWSSGSTWSGGTAPSFTNTSDQIVINSGITVTMDQNVTIDGTLAVLEVDGTLTSSSTTFSVVSGALNGAGTISAETVDLATGAALTFAGTIIANGNLTLEAGTNFSLKSSGILQMGSGSTITMSGGQLSVGSGTLTLNSTYNVIYTTSYSSTGAELTGSGLHNVTVNSGNVTLSGNTSMNGTLALTGGLLYLNGYTLTITGSGTVTTSGSNYIVTNSNNTNAMGFLSMPVTTSSSAYYPIGTASYFFPAKISLNSASNSGSVKINVSDNVYAHPINPSTGTMLSSTQRMVDATWDVQSDISSNMNMNMTLEWYAKAEVNGFDHNHAYISHYTNGGWDIATQDSATLQSNGLYEISRTNIQSLSPFAVFDDKTAAVQPVNNTLSNTGFEVYPNPAMNNIYIQNVSSVEKEMYAQVMNINGKILGTYMISDKTTPIDVSSLPTGMYFIKLYDNNTSATAKFVKF